MMTNISPSLRNALLNVKVDLQDPNPWIPGSRFQRNPMLAPVLIKLIDQLLISGEIELPAIGVQVGDHNTQINSFDTKS
jgi:hypothetical protein